MFLKALLWSGLILPWLTLPIMNTKTIKRYLPVAFFVTLLGVNIYEYAYMNHWWKLNVSIVPWDQITNVSFVYGVFFVGTIWIFRLTYQKFWLYVITNLITDALFAFPVNMILQKIGLYTFYKINNSMCFGIMFCLAIIIYGFQVWMDREATR